MLQLAVWVALFFCAVVCVPNQASIKRELSGDTRKRPASTMTGVPKGSSVGAPKNVMLADGTAHANQDKVCINWTSKPGNMWGSWWTAWGSSKKLRPILVGGTFGAWHVDVLVHIHGSIMRMLHVTFSSERLLNITLSIIAQLFDFAYCSFECIGIIDN